MGTMGTTAASGRGQVWFASRGQELQPPTQPFWTIRSEFASGQAHTLMTGAQAL